MAIPDCGAGWDARPTHTRPFQTQHLLSGCCWTLMPGVTLQFHPSHSLPVYLIRAISNAQGSCPGIELSQGVVAA